MYNFRLFSAHGAVLDAELVAVLGLGPNCWDAAPGCNSGDMLEQRGMTLTELSGRTGLTMANLSILKNGKAKAIRFTTLTLICDALSCTPKDLIDIERDAASG